jgi:16S rRNA (guanine527-N7)-methyltransferase
MPSIEEALRQGLSQLNLSFSEVQISHLLTYQTLIQKWNKVYNLTSVRDPVEMLTHHLLDSLAIIGPLRKHLDELQRTAPSQAVQLLDVGSGAGLPGVVIAICCPQVRVDCVDTVGKKAAFIQQVAVSLKLKNLRGVHARVENLTDHYQVITSRAFASLADFTTWSVSTLDEGGTWIAMKGKHPTEELAELPASAKVFHVEQLSVPGLNADRCLIWLRKPVATIVT